MTTKTRQEIGYFFEVYTKGPAGQRGWDIEVGWVIGATSLSMAKNMIARRFAERFDVLIQCHEACVSDLAAARVHVITP